MRGERGIMPMYEIGLSDGKYDWLETVEEGSVQFAKQAVMTPNQLRHGVYILFCRAIDEPKKKQPKPMPEHIARYLRRS